MTATTASTLELVQKRLRRVAFLAGPWPPALTTALGLALALLGMSRSREDAIGGLGILDALDPLFFIGIAAVVVGAVMELMSPITRRWWFGVHVVVLAFILHGVTGVVEANPRFPTAYLHVGFADQIARHGALLGGLDARFNWPGFFAGSALLQRATGGAPVAWALRYFPFVVNLVTVALVDVLGRVTHVSLHRRRAAQLVFLCCNWIGQDYFSPQATASILYLVVVLLVLTTFPGKGVPDRWRSLLGTRASRTVALRSTAERGGVLAIICLLTAAMVIGHQLTPGFLTLSLGLLAVIGASRLRAYPFAVIAATVGWLSFAAQPFWAGHLQKLTGSAGRISVLVQENVTDRATAATFDRSVVVNTRLAFAGLLILILVVSLFLLRRRRALSAPLACLVLAPWPMLLLQAYGGEMALRVLLVIMPAVSLLVVSALLPNRAGMTWRHLAVLAAVLLALVPAFLIARYGNEKYERIATNDLAVLQMVYDAHETALVMTANSKEPRFFRRVSEVRFLTLASQVPADIINETARRGDYQSRFVFLGETEDALGVELQGKQPGWTQTLARELVDTGRFTVVARSGDSQLLRLIPAHQGTG